MNDFTIELLKDYRYKPGTAIEGYYTGDDEEYWTDGRMLLKRAYISKPLKRMYHPAGNCSKIGVKRESIKRVWDTGWAPSSSLANIPEVVRVAGTSNRWQRSSVLLQTECGKRAILSADKVKFLMMKIKDCTFYISENNNAVQIKSGKKRAGLLMPMRP